MRSGDVVSGTLKVMGPAAEQGHNTVRVRDLGPIAVERDRELIGLRGNAAMAFALLVARFPHDVPRQTLFAAIWGEQAPSDVANNLRVLVHRMRQTLGSPDLLPFDNDAYRLLVAPTQIDSVVFERRVEQGNNHLADGQASQALDALDSALGLWRGPVVAVEAHDDLRSWQTRLETKLLDAQEDRIQALLDLGDAASAAIDTQMLVDEQPYRERRRELLMLALYRSGRQHDALEAASKATQQLRNDLGISPRASFRQLELDILQQAPHLDNAPERFQELPLLPAMVDGGLLGRSQEQQLANELLKDHQVVSICGPAGIGKTTLALSLAHTHAAQAGEVWWCDLAAISPERTAQSNGSGPDESELAFRVGMAAGVRNGSRRPAEIAKILSHRGHVTLVLDNCEHVLDDARSLIDTLRSASNITVLATSRRPLDLASEVVVPLGPLADAGAAVDLFDRVAKAAAPDAALVDRQRIRAICARLDAVPLAIELVARRVRSFSLQEIDDRLEALLHDAKPVADYAARHATMTSALSWSTALLSRSAQQALGVISVFPGSFDLLAFEALVADQLEISPLIALEELLDHGLVQVAHVSDRSRYRLLQPIRQHALQHLAEDRHSDRDRHLEYYLDRLDAAYESQGSTSSQPLTTLVLQELDNYGAVHQWAMESGRLEDDMRLYRPLNIAHLHDRPEPFLWAREVVEQPGAPRCASYGDAVHAAWYGALAVQLDIDAASELVTRFDDRAVLATSPDLGQLACGLHQLLVHHDYDQAQSHFDAVEQHDPYVRYVATTVGAAIRLSQAERHGTNTAAAAANARASIDQGLVWARSIGAKNFETGMLERRSALLVGLGELDQAVEVAGDAQNRAAALDMRHVQAQAQFQLVRCDMRHARTGPEVTRRFADALELAVRSSAQARLRWQLPLAAELFLAHGQNDVAALCAVVGGFTPEAARASGHLSDEDMALGVELASGRSLLDVGSLAIRALRDLHNDEGVIANFDVMPPS